MLVVSYAKLLHHSFISTIYENFKFKLLTLKISFFTYLEQTEISKFVCLNDLSN